MKLECPAKEAEMVAAFLRAEIDAARYGEKLERLLKQDGRDRSLLDAPDLSDETTNRYRARLLGEVRGYRKDEDVFTGMPDDVGWYRATLEPGDLDALMYIDSDYWTDFTGGSRRVRDAVERMQAGLFHDEEVGHFFALAETVRQGARYPEPIVLHNPREETLVILEGHKRLTAYLMIDPIPRDLLRVIVGRSDRIHK